MPNSFKCLVWKEEARIPIFNWWPKLCFSIQNNYIQIIWICCTKKTTNVNVANKKRKPVAYLTPDHNEDYFHIIWTIFSSKFWQFQLETAWKANLHIVFFLKWKRVGLNPRAIKQSKKIWFKRFDWFDQSKEGGIRSFWTCPENINATNLLYWDFLIVATFLHSLF